MNEQLDGLGIIITAIKVLVVFGFLLVTVMLTIWAERKIVARMQQRIGPNRAGPFGILISLADGVKLFFKEDIRPAAAEAGIYVFAPLAALTPALMSFAVIPWGDTVTIGDRVIHLQLADLNVGILFFLAMGSLMVYGVVLAGWSSGSAYPLIGGIRASAQMISYEIAMGLAIVSVVIQAGTLSTRGIVDAQAGTWLGVIPAWFIFSQLPAFVIFLIAGIAETNRAPFDLPEAETELVAGFHTEYSGIKVAMFFLAEYMHIVATSAIATTLFLGGGRGPILPILSPVWPVIWFLGKTGALIFLFIWVRATMPRFRYDKLMRFGWKVLLPGALAWSMVSAVLVVLPQEVDRVTLGAATALVFGIVFLVWISAVTKKRFGSLSPAVLNPLKRGSDGTV